MIKGRLTMRATIERNSAVGTDAHGHPAAPVFVPIAQDVRCFVWSKQSREAVSDKRTAMLEDLRGLFLISTDINELDEVSGITDARGNAIIAGRLRVEGPVQFKHTHLEVAFRRVS